MDLLENPLIETPLSLLANPVVLTIALLVGFALASGLVARWIELVEERTPVRLAAGTRSPVRGRSGPAA